MTENIKTAPIRSFLQVIAMLFALFFLLFSSYLFFKQQSNASISSADSLSVFRHSQSDYEVQLSQTTQELLGQIIGFENVKVRVRADIDFEQSQKTQELLDGQNPVIVSTSGEDVSYAFSKQTVQTSSQGGKVRKLSVTVLINTAYKNYSTDEKKKIKALVYSSVAFDAARGDVLEIIETAFVKPPFWYQKSVQAVVFFVCLILLSAILGMLWVKNIKLSESTKGLPRFKVPDFVNPSVAGTLGLSEQIDGTLSKNALKKAQTLMQKNPDETLTVLRGWLCQGGKNAS